jgi:hypothetical protein
MLQGKWFCFIVAFGLLTGFQCKKKSIFEPDPSLFTFLSFTENPNNYWQVGYSLSDDLDPAQFRLSAFAREGNPIPLWHPGNSASTYYPYTGQNLDSVSQRDISQQWALRKGQVAMEGSNTGQYSMLRFVAPQSGKYHLKVVFEGVHFGSSTTDVHVLLNSLHLFDDHIDGYGGDPAFHAVTGSRPATTYENILHLEKGDIITFAVGYGENKNHYNDTTGLLITLEQG